MRVLITAGGTREPIDNIRFISNVSTGLTASTIADEFAQKGDEVYFVHAIQSFMPKANVHKFGFSSFSDLDKMLQGLLANEKFDAVIHAAAVSDYTPVQIKTPFQTETLPFDGKISSEDDEITIKLKKTHKILDRLKVYSKKSTPKVVAFKLTNTKSQTERLAAVRKLASGGVADYIVLNDISEINPSGQYHFTQLFSREAELGRAESKLELAYRLRQLLLES